MGRVKKQSIPKAPNVNHEICKKIVITFLKKDMRINWAKEIKIAKQLLKNYPNLAAWNGIPDEKRVFSLAYFLLPDGKKFLESFEVVKNFEFPAPAPYHIENRVYGENKQITKKPTSVFEFLGAKYGEKRQEE